MNEQQPKVTTGIQDSTFFPLCGKIAKYFSIVWKLSWRGGPKDSQGGQPYS